jgi:hypothetical protein
MFMNAASRIAGDRAACAVVNHDDGTLTIAAVREPAISRMLPALPISRL